jgi:ABC-type multidrug transport system ATPase subunit
MLKKLKQQGTTILVSTPYMDEASLCDRVALIHHGEILTIETPQAIAASYPRKLYAVESNNNYLLLTQLRENPAVFSAYIFGDRLHVTFKEEWKMKKGKEENNCQLSTLNCQFKEIEPSIEDCFIGLLKKQSDGESNRNP